ncbi:MAG: NAD(P)/FAD-dependent oxidoreductase [Gammaproteobacteria bacterium]|nr:NAD(P)/FAD-dependent oxidoreductase [Gammaproteobacteria bacterium]
MQSSPHTTHEYDVIIIGAGAAGLMCAIAAGQRGRKVLVLDHANKVGKKILMSGGGRCNFTNLYATAENYFSANPHFCKSALKRYTPYDFLALVEQHQIEYVEKDAGQLFCKNSSRDILQMLLAECARAGVKIKARCSIKKISKQDQFLLATTDGQYSAESLVVATGGLSIPTLGATGFGYAIAKQFGINVLATHASLVPFVLQKKWQEKLAGLSGLSTEVSVCCNNESVSGGLLFTHKGLSGPAILQISSYWKPGDFILIDLLPGFNLLGYLQEQRRLHPKMELKNILSSQLPKRLALRLCEIWSLDRPINQFSEKQLSDMAHRFHHWKLYPESTEGYKTAEVTLGGVDTDELSSKTMVAKKQPGLYFIGEVVDVTGQLGGFNFQWAWASAQAAGLQV